MKINIKTQTNKSTQWKEGLNCVNMFLASRTCTVGFNMGLQVTEWGSKDEIEPIITFEKGGKTHIFTVTELSKKLGFQLSNYPYQTFI